MATNMIFRYDSKQTRERPVPAGVQAGEPVLIGTRPAVTLTARGDSTVTKLLPGGYTQTGPNGGAGNDPDKASVAFDGTWEFAVTGATTTTANEVAVFITSARALTLTATGNTAFGFTDYPKDYAKTAGVAPVRIGA
jgi:hypothetical protein